ncbi:MAG: CpsD/CapB family tyrosine-protein kinase [Nitrospirae bacterium]|nr:CpsD/CapB family tyrosine-protein kinase [Candidatus Manganitrophaceae bacterium]
MEGVESTRKPQLEKKGNGELSQPLQRTVRSAEIVYTRTRLVPTSLERLRERRIITAAEEGPLADAFKMLRTQVMLRMRENRWNLLAVTSPGSGEGKTVTTANLAMSLAMEVHQTVLLVDAHLRNPGIHTLFGLGKGPGLVDYLVDQKPIEDLLIHPGIPGLVILPAGRAVQNSSELLTSPQMLGLVNELKYRYSSRVVLFDLPPLLQTADALAFSPYVDAMLLVVQAGRTQTEEVERALHLLRGVPILGTVLNQGG